MMPLAAVEVHADLGPLGMRWLNGYVFSHFEPLTAAEPTCIVVHVGGPFDGAPVRFRVRHVREVKP